MRPSTARAAALIAVMVGVVASCKAPPPPTLAQALTERGSAAERARAFLRVADEGAPAERRRAALLWGLYASEVPSPLSALRAFSRAEPEGALARLAARRLEDALDAARAAPELWSAAGASGWAPVEMRRHWRLRAAELLVRDGREEDAVRALPPDEGATAAERGRALAVLAAGSGGDAARRLLAIEFPGRFAAAFSSAELIAMRRAFDPAELARHAEALLGEGDAQEALRVARRGGNEAALHAARAALELRRSREALAWADRTDRASVEGAVERAEALRQLAWAASRARRRESFTRVLAAAERARTLAPAGSPASRRADLLLAEACTEVGRFADARAAVSRGFERSHPRWEWVWRRLVVALAQRRRTDAGGAADPQTSTRVRRLTEYWRARSKGGEEGRDGLSTLVTYGLPDLPALWAAAELGGAGVAVSPAAGEAVAPGPPPWASDLLDAGRVSDVVVAWRAELEQPGADARAWLGVVELADLPPLDAIPLLIRAEPRLLGGPWSGLPRSLLERYLPLPLRGEVERAAEAAGVPPWVLAAVVRQESAWNPHARSSAGAVGLAQLLPATALEKARSLKVPIGSRSALTEPSTNLLLGASLLSDWRRAFAGSWTAGLAAYNGGERRARDVFEMARRSDGPEFVEALEIPETWDYVHRVVLLAEGYRLLYWPQGGPYPWT